MSSVKVATPLAFLPVAYISLSDWSHSLYSILLGRFLTALISPTSCGLHWNHNFPFTAPYQSARTLTLSGSSCREFPPTCCLASEALTSHNVTLILVSYKSKAGTVGTTQLSVAASQGWGHLNHFSNNTFIQLPSGIRKCFRLSYKLEVLLEEVLPKEYPFPLFQCRFLNWAKLPLSSTCLGYNVKLPRAPLLHKQYNLSCFLAQIFQNPSTIPPPNQ